MVCTVLLLKFLFTTFSLSWLGSRMKIDIRLTLHNVEVEADLANNKP